MKLSIAHIGVLIFCLTTFVAFSQTGKIRVAVVEEPPFVYTSEDGIYNGLSIELWESIAVEGKLNYEYSNFHDELAVVRALVEGRADLSINPNGITPRRLELLDATQPFYVSSSGVAMPRVKQSRFGDFIANFFSYTFLRIVGLLIFIIFSFGAILWLVERKHNRHQFRPGLMGLFDGLWWSAVTMTTVGYGDKAPKTTVGRIIALIWMFTAIIIISGFTASIASTLTVTSFQSSIDSIEELKGQNFIGTIDHSQSESFLIEHDIRPEAVFKNISDGLRALSNHEVSVLVYDKSELRFFIDQFQLEDDIVLLPVNFNRHYQNFLLPKESPLTEIIDPLLLKQINAADWPQVLKKYKLGEE